MAFNVDIRTLFLFYAFFNACIFFFLLLISEQKNNKHQFFIRIYTTGKLLQTITWLFFGLRGELVSETFSVIVANPMYIFGTAFDLFPFIWFKKENYSKYLRITNIVLVMFSATFLSLTFSEHGIRSAIASFILFLIFGSGGAIILSNTTSSKTQKIAALLSIITAIAMAFRAYLTAFENVSNSLFSETPIYIISYVLGFIVPFYWTILFMMLLNEDNSNEIIFQKNTIALDNEKLANLNATKDKIFSIIAHDLRGPMGGIIQLGEMLSGKLGKLSNIEKEETIKIITQTAKSTHNVLSNLLQWAKSESGLLDIDKKSISINELVFETEQLLKENIINKSLHFKNSTNKNSFVFADFNMAFTIIRNLVANAIKFTPEGGTIEITNEQLGDFMKIYVRDNGVGISRKVIDKLFHVDSNYFTNGTNNEPGTGIGLVLCKEFVHKNGGEIGVESEENIGSTFYFTLPIHN